MKKILLGLLAVSVVSMAAPPDLEATPTAGTNVFQQGQEGAISVTGKITSDIPVVKYVVYSLKDGVKDDVVTLADFLVNRPESAVSGFADNVNPKVVVKRINGATEEELDPSENVTITSTASSDDSTVFSDSAYWTPFVLLSDSDQEALITAVGDVGGSGVYLTSTGYIRAYSDGSYYPNKYSIGATVNGNKEIEFANSSINWSSSPYFPEEAMVNVENFLAGGKQIRSDFKLLIKVQ